LHKYQTDARPLWKTLFVALEDCDSQEAMAARIAGCGVRGISQPLISRWQRYHLAGVETGISEKKARLALRFLDVWEKRDVAPPDQFALGVRHAVEQILPSLNSLQQFVPDLIPISPAVGGRAADSLGKAHRGAQKEDAKRRAGGRKKRNE